MKNNNESHVSIYGMNFYITWKNSQEGYDQRGIKWTNKNNPTCSNDMILTIAKDTYNLAMALSK